MLLAVSGFSDALERSTLLSLEMAELSEEAPRETAAAARGVGSLPEIAGLTSQQASALAALADALEVSADRIRRLDGTLKRQSQGMSELRSDLRRLRPEIACVRNRLAALIEASEPVPLGLGNLRNTIEDLSRTQRRSVRHLRSINRKLAALGVIATAQGVEAPQVPDTSVDLPEVNAPAGASC